LLAAGVLAAAGAGGLASMRSSVLSSALAEQPTVPVAIWMPVPHRSELLISGHVTVELRMRRSGRVRVAPSLRVAGGRAVALGRARMIDLLGGRRISVSLPLSAHGRSAIAPCTSGQVTLTISASGLGKPRTASRALRLDPPDCVRFYGPRAIWNRPIPAGAPLDEDSAEVVHDLAAKVAAGYQTGMPPTINTDSYAPPVYTVRAGQPRVRVRLDAPPGHAPELVQAFSSVPLRAGALPAPGTDSELVVWQPATDTMWEFWRLRRDSGGWVASWGGRLDHVSTGPGHFAAPRANWGTTASSLPLAGGMITPRELKRGVIDHALSLALPATRAGVFSLPAQRTDGESNCPHAVPEGARLRLDPALDVDSLVLSPPVAALARAAQRYGIYVRDQSGSVSFYAQSAVSLTSDPYPGFFGGQAPYELLKQFPWSHLQVMRMTLRRMPGQSAPPLFPPPLISGCS
jgi:hypothetical protein